jgi:hypothetical protein
MNGMITSANQLTIGRELWRIYGHVTRTATRLVIAGPVITNDIGQYVDTTAFTSSGDSFHDRIYLADFGVGANYNMNRIFETAEQALAFYDSPMCTQYREYWAHRTRWWDTEDVD